MSTLPLMLAIRRAEAEGFTHFAAALRVLLAAELSAGREYQGILDVAIRLPVGGQIGDHPMQAARRHAWHATRRSMGSRSPFAEEVRT